MRFLNTLLLSLCCLAVTLQSNAADVSVKPHKASSEYSATERAAPNDALNDYHQVTSFGNTVTNHSFPKEASHFFAGNADKNITAYILNDSFQNIRLLICGNHAKTFKTKLIFPQHYHW